AAGRAALAAGERAAAALLARVRAVLDAEPLARIDYAALVDADSLRPITIVDRPALLALAVFVGRTRLIDNAVLTATS
ncbi:MAG: pantoate--beta-alanine ligase, partial [Candidatus Binatia bacterium]